MINPQKVVIPAGYGPYQMGLYRFKDGVAYLVKLHVQSGDWQTIRPASADEKAHLKAVGK